MKLLHYYLITIYLIKSQFKFHSAVKTYHQKLVEDLFDGQKYDKGIRPVIRNNVINMTLGIEFIQIIAVDERSQRITIKVWMRMQWMNEILRWDPAKYDNITVVKLTPDRVWRPDIMLYDEVDEGLTASIDEFKTLVHQEHSGLTYWSSPTMFTSSCHINVKNFPFDAQTCTLKYGSWGYDQSELNLFISDTPSISEHYVNHTEWDIENIVYQKNSIKYSMHSNAWADITVHFTIRRKPLYYLLNVIVPCVILMAIILMSFFLPPESGERAAIIITVLLAFTVYLHLVSQSLPTTSDSSPVLSVFYISIMAESSFSLLATSAVLVIHHRGSEKGIRPLPNWVKYWFIDYLAKKFGVIQSNLQEYSFTDLLALGEEDAIKQNQENKPRRKGQYKMHNGVSPSPKEAATVENNTMNSLLSEVTVITQLIHDMNRQDEIEEEWHFLAKVLDRLFFWAFFFLFLLTSIFILVPVYIENI